MRFSLNKKDIIEIIQHLIGVIPAKSSMLTLSNFKIEVEKEATEITITASDLNITTIVKIPKAEDTTIEAGSILIHAKKFTEIISALPDKQINFSLRDDYLTIECGDSSFEINYSDTELFPEICNLDTQVEYRFNAGSFKKLISNTAFCTSSDSAYNTLTGVNFNFQGNLLTMAASDTKRIAEAKLVTDYTNVPQYEIILPLRALSFIEKNIKSETDEVIIKYDEHRISFYLKGGIQLISNKYSGKFPNYTLPFQKIPESSLVINRNIFRDAVKRVSLLSEDDDNCVVLFLNNKEIKIESSSSEKGNAKEIIKYFEYDGPETFYSLNSRLLISIINIIETTDVVLKFSSTEEPIWLLNKEDIEPVEIRFLMMSLRNRR